VLWVAVDAAHMTAVLVWLGGLIALWFAPKVWLAEPEAVRPVNRFSFAASVCVPVIVGTGLLQTWKLAGGLNDVTATTWGRMLLAKTMLVVAMVALGAISRWLLEHEGAEHLRRTVLTEAVIGVLVVGLAAGIVSQAPRPPLPSQPYSQQLAASGLIASVTISPGHVGSNEIHVIITPPGGSIAPVASLVGRVSLPSAAIPSSPITLKKEGPNHYSGSITFPRRGDWTIELIVGVTESSNVQVKSTVHIP
jgi:copper transport protein